MNAVITFLKKYKIQFWRFISVCLVVYDVLAVCGSYFLALWLRFEGRIANISSEHLDAFLKTIPAIALVSVVIFYLAKMYHSVWRFAGYIELIRVSLGTLASSVLHTVCITAYMSIANGRYTRMPLSYYVIGAGIQAVLLVGIRFSYRFLLLVRSKYQSMHVSSSAKPDEIPNNVMIIGAGAAGQLILRDVTRSLETNDRVRCIIDDNPNKWARYIDGVKVVGGREDILISAKKYKIDKIYVAIPTAAREDLREILNICEETNCEVKNLPGVYQLVNGEVNVAAMKDVSVEDLLGREPIRPDMKEIVRLIMGKTVLVTGGGGSIGSELCRQIASHGPKKLIIFDVYENNAYAIQQELNEIYRGMDLEVLIGSVRDSRRLEQIFGKFRPNIVFHAAAHKHVPLMEDSPCEAIKNNVIGTYKTAYAAMMNGCERFVLISTDKAVNPTNIMGASKRLCEMIVQSFDKKIKEGKANEIPRLFTHYAPDEEIKELPDDIKTEYVAVRFGNVLGSNGSVVPLFKKQIEQGGPVRVTHPDIIRYFMTIPEAVSLVLSAGTFARGGEIFVLDMGSPVKIDTLARNLIKLSGFKPDVDIKIEYTGLRPGEKLFEEKLMAEEGLKTTSNKLIHIGKPIPFDVDEFCNQLEGLKKLAYENDDGIFKMVEDMVSTYHPANNTAKV